MSRKETDERASEAAEKMSEAAEKAHEAAQSAEEARAILNDDAEPAGYGESSTETGSADNLPGNGSKVSPF